MDLYYDFSTSHCVMVHVRVEEAKTAGGEGCHLVRVKNISHPQFECSRDDGDVFAQGMKVRCDAVSIRHLQADGVVTAGSRRVAFEYGKLGARS